jgi:hypothetical protein
MAVPLVFVVAVSVLASTVGIITETVVIISSDVVNAVIL